MPRTTRRFACLCAATSPLMALAQPARAQPHPAFGYMGSNGPIHWGGMSEHWQACSLGRNQSPIDLARPVDAQLPPVEFDIATGAYELLHTGHALQASYRPGSSVVVDGQRFALRQFHFHAPSEHHFEGRDLPLEAHLVHEGQNGALAVVAILFEDGAANAVLARLFAAVPTEPGKRVLLPDGITVRDLLPADPSHVRYSGSLTTPPCSEGVRWILMTTRMTASAQQIATVHDALGFANNRPVQPLWARLPLR